MKPSLPSLLTEFTQLNSGRDKPGPLRSYVVQSPEVESRIGQLADQIAIAHLARP
jgi:hypothetical protein